MSPLRAIVLLPLLACLSTSPAVGQTIEGGASIASSCKGSDGSFCNDTHSGLRASGPYASTWLTDRIEIGGRVVWLRQPDIESGPSFGAPPVAFTITDRRRTILQGEAVWHFRRGKRIRPMFGIGIGGYRDRALVACQPAGCETRPFSGLTAGESLASHRDTSLVVGISSLVHPRLRVRGGWRYHNPFKDELALSEWFVGAGYVMPF